MKNIFIQLITFYQNYLSLDTGLPKKLGLVRNPICGMYPTCSEYAKQAILKYGSVKGLFLGLKRFFRCHPWQKNHFDPVP